MPWNALSDANIKALSIVTKGANRKRFYLRKEDAEDPPEIFELGHSRLLKGESDWTTAYCVVAEPGWEENPGILAADQSVPDVWASEDEIRKACHGFMGNGALVTKLHESLESYGALVENFIAQTDMWIDGEEVKKGSWVIGLHPTEDGRDKIEAGEFTGVSIEGTAHRTFMEKAGLFDENKHPRNHGKFSSSPGSKGAIDPKKAKELLAHLGYTGKDAVKDFQRDHSLKVDGTAGVKTSAKIRGKRSAQLGGHTPDGWKGTSPAKATTKKWNALPVAARKEKMKAFRAAGGKLPKGRRFTADGSIETHHGAAKDRKKKDKGLMRKGSSAENGSMGGVNDVLRKIGEKLGLSAEDMASLDEIEKGASFADRMAERDFEDELPQAFDVLRSVVCNAFYPPSDETRSPSEIIDESLNEFGAWARDLLEATPVAKIQEQIDEDAEWSLEKAKLSAADRKKLPKSAFVFPDKAPGPGSYPIHDMAHAKNALARSSDKPEEKKVKAAVYAKHPKLKVAKADGSSADISTVDSMSQTDETGAPVSIEERVEKLEGQIEKIGKGIDTLVEKAGGKEGDEKPTVEDVSKKLDDLTTVTVASIKKIGDDIEKLGSGGSAQVPDADKPEPDKVAKAFKDLDLDPNLAGIA